MLNDLTDKTDEELEDLLLDLCGRLTLSNKEVELLQAVEEERERRSKLRKVEVRSEN